MDANVGVLLELPPSGAAAAPTDDESRMGKQSYSPPKGACLGYVHISDATDDHIERLEKKFKVGATVRARVIGRRVVDGVATASCKKTVVEQPFLSLDELTPGMKVKGEVVAVEPYGAVIKLAPGVKALLPPHHVSDIPGRTTNAKVCPGARLNFRVLSVDVARSRATVTRKKTILNSDLDVIATMEDATRAGGATTHGVVTGVEPYGVFVSLYGALRGLAGAQDLGLAPGQTPTEAFQVGQCVRARVIRADNGPGKLKLSLAPGGSGDGVVLHDDEGGGGGGGSRLDDVGAPPPGTIIESAVVKRVDADTGNVLVTLPGGVPGVITAAHVSDHPVTGAALVATYAPDDAIGPLVALEAKPRRSILSRKTSLVTAARSDALPASVADVVVGASYPGYVASATQNAGVFVRFLGRLTGLAPPSQLVPGARGGDADPEECFAPGQSVRARVTAVDATVDPPRLSLSLIGTGFGGGKGGKGRKGGKDAAMIETTAEAALVTSLFADVDAADAIADARAAAGDGGDDGGGGGDGGDDEDGGGALLSAELTASKLAPGSSISCVVHATREYGVLMDVPDVDSDLVALMAFHQTPAAAADDDDDAAPPPDEGTKVNGVVLDVSRRDGVVDVGARPGLLAMMKPGPSPKKTRSKKTRGGGGGDASTTYLPPPRPKKGTETVAVVELVKPEYVVLSLPKHGGAIGYCAARSVNGFGYEDVGARWTRGEEVDVVVVASDSKSKSSRLLLAATAADATATTDRADGGATPPGRPATATTPPGTTLRGVVREVQGTTQVIVDLPSGGRGRLHATEVAQTLSAKRPLSAHFAVGAGVDVVVLGPAGDKGGSMLELSTRRGVEDAKKLFAAAVDAGGGDGGGAGVAGTALLATASPGDVIAPAVVAAVSSDTLAVSLAPGVTCRIPRVETGDSASVLKRPLTERFAVGETIEGGVAMVAGDVARRKAIVTLRAAKKRDVVAGAKLGGIVTKVLSHGGGVFVQLNGRQRGRVHVTDLSDAPGSAESQGEPWKKYAPGDAVDVRVLRVDEDDGEIDLSTRASDMKRARTGRYDKLAIETCDQLTPGTKVAGFVKQCTKGGCFVALGRTVDARVKLCNLSNEFVDDPPKAFPKGALVTGTVLSVDAENERVEITLRADGGDGGGAAAVNAPPTGDAPDEGAVLMGTVRRVQTYGVFVTLDDCGGRSGLCHISAFADARIDDGLDAHVRAGERVRVKGAFYLTLVPIRPRWRGERRSLRTFPGVSLRPPLGFNTRPRRLSNPSDAFELHPDVRSYGTTQSLESGG